MDTLYGSSYNWGALSSNKQQTGISLSFFQRSTQNVEETKKNKH